MDIRRMDNSKRNLVQTKKSNQVYKGNSRSSTKPAVLYAMYDGDGNFQKWGITDKVQNPKSGRYGSSLPDDWDVREMT